ncbi:MAG TPA: YfcE family phosphodiesterase [Acidobacteria bacterium]|nr:YfcE family phosphodiesterase [Acidobacteriota bacterium]
MIGIMSDSHDYLPAIRQAVNLFNRVGCSLVIHAGDVVAPFAALELKNLRCPVKAVFGNCDGEKDGLLRAFQDFGQITPAPLLFSHENLRFLISHYPPETQPAGDIDIVVFGHTHRAQVNRDGNLVVINPGETCGWVKGVSTVALLDPATLVVDIVPL